MNWIKEIQIPDLRGFLEILVLTVAFNYLIRFFRGTRAAQVLTGLVVFVLTTLFLTQVFQLEALTWLLQRFFVYLAIAVLVIFQPEIRRGLAEIGKQPLLISAARGRGLVDALVRAALLLSERKIGALVAIQREIGTRAIQETGKQIDAVVTSELLASIFFPHTPLHDGGVILAHDRIAAAGCLFPLAQENESTLGMGTRHRAAIGLTEETDAVVVVVSEETGILSVAFKGRLSRGLDEDKLRRILTRVLLRSRTPKPRRFAWLREKLHLTTHGALDSSVGEEDLPHG
ncbi:MAG: diadenylate cyclase CdaA [Kiritimatiellia bacterium]|nr:diadenylate cyclase CdaA [Kiritimatiellia bacterium]